MSRLKVYYYVITLTFVCIALILVWQFSGDKDINRSICLEKKRMAFSGLIKYTFKDVENKGFFTLVIQGKIGEYRYVSDYGLVTPEAYIEVGDSIYKYRDTFKFRIVKNTYSDSVIVIDRTLEVKCD